MRYTPVELRHVKIGRSTFGGYRKLETEKLIEDIADSFEEVWRDRGELTDKLEEAERQFQSGNPGSAVFFASRAKRVADALRDEARRASNTTGMRKITAPRANLRAGPSTTDAVLFVLSQATPVLPQRSDREWVLVRTPDGAAGWVHASLLDAR